jgi:Tfp pilus assembly protein PilZ
MSHKIVLASVSEEENLILKKKIDPLVEELGDMRFLSVRPQGLATVLDPNSSLVVVNVLNYTKEIRASVLSIRAAGYTGPVLVISKVESQEAIKELQNMTNTVFLEKPFEVRDLQGIVRKFLNDSNVYQRIHRRYNTVMSADVEWIDSRPNTSSTLFNLSKGGAYIELAENSQVKKGDQLKVYITLDEIQKSYAMQAKVVWCSSEGMNGGCGVGLEFLGRADLIGGM